MEKANDPQFIVCPVCAGAGKNRLGLNCAGCAGLGLGVFFHNRFLYWGRKLGKAVIKLRRLKKLIDLFIDSLAYLLGLSGLFALGWWIYKTGELTGESGSFLFWRVRHWLILAFWLGLLADMFILYRLSRARDRREKIRLFKDGDKRASLPDNWEELKTYDKRLDVSGSFSEEALTVVENAVALAAKFKQAQAGVMHLFFSLLKDREAAAFFARLNVDGRKLISKVENRLLADAAAGGQGGKPDLSGAVKEVLLTAYIEAYEAGQKRVRPLNFILAAVAQDKYLEEILYDLEVDRDKINNVIAWFRVNEQLIENYKLYKKMARFKPGTSMDRAYTAVATPVLNHFARDLTIAAKWGRLELCVAREKETREIFESMESGQPGAVLVGPVGVGKRTIVGGIAQLMVKEEVPRFLRDKRLVELDVARLVSGVGPAQAEERLLVIIDEIARAGNIILYIEDLENLAGISAGGEESLELSEVLSNALDRKMLFCLAAATKENYVRYLEGRALGNAMVKLEIKEPEINQAIQMVESKVGILEARYKIYFSYHALEQTVKLTSAYMHDKYLPAKAINVLESTAVKIAKRCAADEKQCLCTREDIAGVISEITSIPMRKVAESEGKKLLNLEEDIHKRMINQEEAVNMVASSLRRARAEMREGKRPIASFLFLGPTGVGKTELAKTVADIYFGDKRYLIRLDMSEYQHPDSVNKMIGDTSGVKGYLTEAVRQQPFALILLDEFEKSHSDILNLFLQVMDDGRLTDGQGKTIDFTNAIIIATSNVGAVYIQEQIGQGTDIDKIKQVLINEHLNKVMKPELINRFDGVVVFKPLSRENVIDITRLMLDKIRAMLENKGMFLRAEPAGIEKLAAEGFDPKFGARPLRRLLQDKIENSIANKVLAGELARRDTVVIDDQAAVQVEKGQKL